MPYGLYVSAEGAQAQAHRIEVLAHNLANVDTTGFKRMLGVVQARHAEAIEQGSDHPGSKSINDIGGGVYLAETKTQFSTGVFKQTGVPTHLAVDGDGFFVVEQDGQAFLTRSGNFQLSNDGRLVTAGGQAVLSSDRQPIRLDPNLPWRLDETGVIVQAGTRIPLALEKPASPGDLVPRGRNQFEPIADPIRVRSEQRRVRGGYLEHSNVQPALEMMELIEASRAFEANVKLIQNQDQVMGTLISRVLRSQ